ncbi:helix-turn-helix domain-containing protein [Micromonospora sp. NPDC050980]|uniref:helix-turn-helix domain-containing protein n=1 Tax=Micromonospora sp. NPDC050980 TaxID=3155161 RepID=UPI00340F9197
MARAERPLDPTAGPLQAFAADLRALRDRAGRPTYQALARRAHRSASSLSEAAGGRRLPTLDTTLAYVRALGGDETEWTARWRAVAAAIGSAPESKPGQPDLGPKPGPGSELGPESELRPGPASRPGDSSGPFRPNRPASAALAWTAIRPNRHVRVLAAAVLLTGFVAVPWLAGGLGTPGDGGPSSAAVGPEPPAGAVSTPSGEGASPAVRAGIRDGADPKDANCAADPGVTTVDSAAVLLHERVIGTVELRYAPACGVSWPRFVPVPGGADVVPRPARIQLTVTDGDQPTRTADFAMDYGGISTFGNLLTSTKTCVYGQVQLSGAGWRSAVGRTGCWRGATEVRPIP